MINIKDRLNGLKGSTKMKKIESIFKYQSGFYSIQSNNDVNHRGVKLQHNNKLFPSFNAINGKSTKYRSKGVLRHYHYRSDPKIGPGIFAIIIITCSFHACTTKLYINWDDKI